MTSHPNPTFLQRCFKRWNRHPQPKPTPEELKRQAVDRTETFGGYMSVDRIAALKFNWDEIQRLQLPRSRPKQDEAT